MVYYVISSAARHNTIQSPGRIIAGVAGELTCSSCRSFTRKPAVPKLLLSGGGGNLVLKLHVGDVKRVGKGCAFRRIRRGETRSRRCEIGVSEISE